MEWLLQYYWTAAVDRSVGPMTWWGGPAAPPEPAGGVGAGPTALCLDLARVVYEVLAERVGCGICGAPLGRGVDVRLTRGWLNAARIVVTAHCRGPGRHRHLARVVDHSGDLRFDPLRPRRRQLGPVMPGTMPLIVTRPSDAYQRVTFDNPPLNLIDPETVAALRDLLSALEADPAVKVVVFDSADADFFIAHFDVARGADVPKDPGPTGLPWWPDIATRLMRAPFVSIAEVRGRARGLGSEFALACDLRFASRERAVFGQPEVGLGLVPGGGSIEMLTRLAGRSRTLEIILGADDMDADTAQQYGWINRALPDGELPGFVDRLARRIAAFDGGALAAAKTQITLRAGVPSGEEMVEANRLFRQSSTWPGTQRRLGDALAQGLQQRGDFELHQGARLVQDH